MPPSAEAFDRRTIEGLADSYTFIVNPDGDCVLNPRAPKLVGTKPWDWCIPEDRAKCREVFIEACMFRKENLCFECRMHLDHRALRFLFRLFPLETGQVMCLFTRVFEGDISQRERHVLALLAGGADVREISQALGISQSTTRDHIASIKRKLNIIRPEGFRLAAHHFGLAGAQSARTEPPEIGDHPTVGGMPIQ